MTTHNPRAPVCPPLPATICDPAADFEHAPVVAETGDVAKGNVEGPSDQLSAIGWLCDNILASVDQASGLSDNSRQAIALRVTGILAMFSENEQETRAAHKKISSLKRDLRGVKEQLKVLRAKLFGPSSDQAPDPESDFGFAGDEPDEQDEITEGPRPKGKRARKFPEDIPTIFQDHYPEDMTCCTCGCQMASIKREVRVGNYRIVPEHVVLVKHAYHTCACNRELCKENKPVTAKAQGFIMKGRGLEINLVIEAACQKFFESSALFRMARRFANSNIMLARQTLGRNLIHVAPFLRPVCDSVREHVKAGTVAHMDETPLRVQAPGTGRSDIGYLWAICRDERGWKKDSHPAVYYHYAPSRSGEVAERLLEGATLEFLLTDGYAAYNRLFRPGARNAGLIALRCWAHSRRKFVETLKATDSRLAAWVKKRIDRMYRIEKKLIGLPPAAREAVRQGETLPIISEIRAELMRNEGQAQGALKTAINYTLNAFEALQRFVFDGRLEIDNNPVERCMRLIALAKKNSIGAGSHDAAEAWAIYFTLIESARLNRINPRAYLTWVLGEIERTRGQIDHALLLPWHCPVGRLAD